MICEKKRKNDVSKFLHHAKDHLAQFSERKGKEREEANGREEEGTKKNPALYWYPPH